MVRRNCNDEMWSLTAAAVIPDESISELTGGQLIEAVNRLRRYIEDCDTYLHRADVLTLVKDVVRVHIQEVMSILNWKSEAEADDALDGGRVTLRPLRVHHTSRLPDLPNTTHVDEIEEAIQTPKNARERRFVIMSEIDSASFSERHYLLMGMYVSLIRQNVVDTVCEQVRQGVQARARRASIASRAAVDTETNPSSDKRRRKVNEIWCMLMFRMLCWLRLHDFHRKDIQVSKSDVYESRMPVYIV